MMSFGENCAVRIVSGAPTPHELRHGLNLIKSPKGSGKTRALIHLLRDERSVLLIGHRRALIRESCNKIGLDCYLDEDDGALDGIPRLGISVDSLVRVPAKAGYSVVVLDESEQLLAHFLSDTLDRKDGPGRERLFVEFKHRVKTAAKVVALDADLGWVTYNTLTRMRS